MVGTEPRTAARRTNLLAFAALAWVVGGLWAGASVWPPDGGTFTEKAGSLLLMLIGVAMATMCWIGAMLLAALRNANR